ncbi:MAG: hypothetical protein WA771_07065, partial [Chthoniobacterales bacterium]
MKIPPLLLAAAVLAGPVFAQEQSPFDQTVQSADYLEPAIPHPEQAKEAAAKLAALEGKFGRKPNIVVLLVDDMGWGDPGTYGGGLLIGAPTPNIDQMAA